MADRRPEIDEVLAMPGDWEIRITIYRNGRRVGTCDTAGWETYKDAAYWAGEGLSTGDIEQHVPKRRVAKAPVRNRPDA